MPSVSELEREATNGHRMNGIQHHRQHPLMDVVQELTARVKALEEERDYFRKLAEDHLEKTADGVFLVICIDLYCPKCRGKVRQEYDLCYCDECGNRDCHGEPPLPLFYTSTLANPREGET